MSASRFWVFGFLAALAGCAPSEEAATPEQDLEARAREVHAAALTIDTHDDIGFDSATDSVDPLDADPQVNLEKMNVGWRDVGLFIVYVGQTRRTPHGYRAGREVSITKFEA